MASWCACEICPLTDLWNIYMSGNCFFIVALHQLERHRHRLLRGSPEFAFPLYYLCMLWLHVAGPWGARRRDYKPISDRIAPCRLSLILQVWGERGGSSGCTALVLSDTLIWPAVDTHYGRFPLRPKATDASLFPFRCFWSWKNQFPTYNPVFVTKSSIWIILVTALIRRLLSGGVF